MKRLLFFLTAVTIAMSLSAQKPATIDDISQFVSWDLGAMSMYQEGAIYVITNADDSQTFCLEEIGNGVYQEISEDNDMIAHGARFVSEKVCGVTTLTAYHN